MQTLRLFTAGMIFLAAAAGAHADAVCKNNTTVSSNLNWSRGDTGHNEGAGCAVSILAGKLGLAVPAAHQFLPYGEVFKRDAMMRIAREAYNKGYHSDAIAVAICSQVHNGPIHQCLVDNTPAIDEWFQNWR